MTKKSLYQIFIAGYIVNQPINYVFGFLNQISIWIKNN